MLRTFIQITAITLTLLASFFWIRSSVILSTKDIAALAGTYWDYSPPALESLAKQKTDSLIASLLLLMSFILQMINIIWPMRWKDFEVNRMGVAMALLFSVLVLLLLNLGASHLKNYFYAEAEKVCKNKAEKKVP